MSLVKNLPTQLTRNKKRKPDKGLINKKLLNLEGKLRKKIDILLRNKYCEKKVVNEKLPDLEEVLRRKLTLYD